jgi:hypothetical protein
MDALLALVRERPAAFTTQPISREFDEAGVKRDRRWVEELREREHVRNRPTRLPRPIRLRRIADGNQECRDLMISLPPDITFEKRSLPEGGWSYDFRHCAMGALGRMVSPPR